MKLPSATGMRPFWDEHRKFMAAASGMELFVKAVVTRGTVREDIFTCAGIIAERNALWPFIIQPASGHLAPAAGQLLSLQEAAMGILGDVRVIPQAHRMLGVM